MGYNGHLRDSNDQATAVFTEKQVDGDEYTREEEDAGTDSYWNYTEQ